MSKNLIVRFAGEGGQGVVGGAELMASAAAQGGYHVLTFSTFPSQIKGGPAWGQARISSEPIPTPGDYLDVLVAQNQYAYEMNIPDLREGGLVVYNSEEFEVTDNARAIGISADRMAREAGNPLASTIILIGAVAKMAGVSIEALEAFITKRWTRGRPGDEQIVQGNINALRMGVIEAEKTGLALEDLAAPPTHEIPRILIRGSEAAGL
ncbi:MAG: 2-oxoacid:acceptor oxidoreductase family protein, partial [Chloroflexi bacterium]|nr:2-oxoacid:acceptor oxidoreductase family protein [Chloroflexota bacterium]